jgi:uncharacterized protein YyaL (SSP411 family)
MVVGLLVAAAPTIEAKPRSRERQRAKHAAATSMPELPRPQPGDAGVPSQETFRDWPPQPLQEQTYWLPWDARSFLRARLLDRPVLFVMAPPWSRPAQRMLGETLSDGRVLRAVNASYVSVLLNPDRRPDIRERYQTGAWPVVAFLLPNGQPLLGSGSESRELVPVTTSELGADPMLALLREGRLSYEQSPGPLFAAGRAWTEQESEKEREAFEDGEVDRATSDAMATWLRASADRQDGGFGLAPKFVVPGLVEYAALRQARFLPALALHARFTLERLVASPLYDARHGGIHRIAAAPGWSEIQYEKLLEGNAQLIRELVFALRHQDDPELRGALVRTAAFVTAVLGRPAGGFSAAQWADPRSPDGGGYWRGESKAEPPVDALVLTGPNATAGAALIRAGILLGDGELVRAGTGAVELVLRRAYRTGRGLEHVIEPAGEPEHRFLSTQAEAAFGLIDAYQSTGDPRFLDAGRDAVEFAVHNLLLPDESPLLVDHLPGPATTIGLLVNARHPVRPNLELARAMLRLAHLGQDEGYRKQALGIVRRLAGGITGYRVHGVSVALAIEEAIQEPVVVEIRGAPDREATRALRDAAVNTAWPWTIVSWGAPQTEDAVALIRWQGRSEQVMRPAELAERVAELTGGSGLGAP